MLHFGPFAGAHPLSLAAASLPFDRIRIATAFASEAGVEVLRDKVGKAAFDAASKEALIGVENGFTQPEALDRLAKAPSSSVRAPSGAAALAAPGLRTTSFFHPKVYAFEDTAGGSVAILSGSANLTAGGLLNNIETLFAWSGPATDPVAQAFDLWWTAEWANATVVNAAFVASYTAARPKLPTPPGIPLAGPAAATLKAAGSLWLELTHKPEGGSYNQIELLLTAHHFFYPNVATPPKASPRALTFVDTTGATYTSPDRSVRFNGPPLRKKGNSMWRVYMPTAREGLKGYQDGDVLVRYQRTGTPDEYLVEIADAQSAQAQQWIAGSAGVATKPGARPRRMGWS
jgi:HKD family nuclease